MDIATLGLRVDANGFVRSIQTSEKALSGLGATGSRVASALKSQLLGLGAIFGVGVFAHKLMEETTASQDALAQLQAAVESTGGAAGLTVAQLDDMSAALQRTSRYGDEAVKGAQAVLLTFNKIKGAEFRDATQAVLDLSARMGGDLKSAALQVGKALNDPAIGLTALTRSGVSFTTQQQEVIKHLFATGKAAEAQRLILAELNKEFGGSAKAALNTLGGSIDHLQENIGDLFEVSRGGSSGLIDLIHRIDAGVMFLKDHASQAQAAVGALFVAVGAGASVYLALSIAVKTAAIWQGIMTGAQAIQSWTSLIKAVRSAKDAMALLSMVSQGAVGAVAAVIALGAGFIAYRKLVASLNAETEKQNEELSKLAAGAGDAAGSVGALTDAEKDRLAQLHAANADMVRQAQQNLALAGLQGEAQARLRIGYDAVNKSIAARREQSGALLTETLGAIDSERRLALQALEVEAGVTAANKRLEEQAQVLKNFAENVQRSFADTFTKVLNDGISNFSDLFDGVKQLFFRMVAEMAAAKMMKTLGGSLAGALAGVAGTASGVVAQPTPAPALPADWPTIAATGSQGPLSVTIEGVTATASKSLFASVAPYLGVAAASFGVGTSVGGLTSNRTMGTLGGAAAGAATGALIGSVVPVIGTAIGAAVGGIAGAIGGFVGSTRRLTEELKKQQEVLSRNNARLSELALSLDGFAVNGTSLEAAGPFAARLAQILAPGGSGVNALGSREITQAFTGESLDPQLAALTRTYGLSFQQLGAIAKETGIELFDSAGKLVPDSLRQLAEAIGLTVQSITTFGDGLDETKRRQSAYNEIFDVADTPAQQLSDAFAILEKMSPDLLKKQGLSRDNLDSEAGRAALLAGLQDTFRLIDSGALTADLLGSFTDKNQLLDAILATKDGLDAFGKSLHNVTTDFPRAMDVLLYEQRFGTGAGGSNMPGVTPPTAPAASSPTAALNSMVVNGGVTIVSEGGETGEEILQKLEAAVADRAARGGRTYLPRTVVNA